MCERVVPDLGELRAELRAAGLFEQRERRTAIELLLLCTAFISGLWAIASYGTWVGIALVPVLAVLATTIAMYGHEASHRSLSSSPRVNTIIAYIAFTVFSGLSTSYWRNKHDRLHHGHPNVESVDPDIKPFPFASSSHGHDGCGPKERFFQRYFQRWLFWPMSTLMCVGIRRSSIVHMWHQPKSRTWAVEVTCLALHHILWIGVPLLVWGLRGYAVYAGLWAGVGILLALIFAPAHMGLPIVASPRHDWVHQLETTRNLEMPRALSFFFVGLDYQVEHHLFPKIPHANLPRAAAITRAWCERRGVTYISTPYFEALAGSIAFMGRAWATPAAVLA